MKVGGCPESEVADKILCEADGSNLTIITTKDEVDPDRCNTCSQGLSITWDILRNPAMVFLAFGACIRHFGKKDSNNFKIFITSNQ